MSRISFSQVLNSAKIDYCREYNRLYVMFFEQKVLDENGNNYSLKEYCALNFMHLPFKDTCISLDDFDDYYGFHFLVKPNKVNIDYLVSFCEYSFNLAVNNITYDRVPLLGSLAMQTYLQQINEVIDKIGYIANRSEKGITDFVPKDQSAIAVAEIIDPSLSYKVIEYNHHSMKGDLERKKAVILALADKLEPQQKKLKQINSTLETDLFYLLNNVNLRHNNVEQGKNQNPSVASMNKDELERWYDDTYQMCLLAFLELDNIERKKRIDELKNRHQG